jgi:hypothetical protein
MGRIVREVPNVGKLAEIGKIKIGEKKLNAQGKEYPTSLDYFRATGDFAPMFYEKFPDNINKLPVFFHSDNVDEVCNEEYVIRDKAGKLVATGDGKNWKLFNKTTEKYEPAVLDIKEANKLGIMKMTLTLRFLIPQVPVIGLWKFETRGEASSIPQMRDTFDYVQQNAGSIVNIPFDLVVNRVKSQKPGVASQYSVVRLIPNLGQKHIELLSDFYAQGNRANRLLSTSSIEALGLPPASVTAELPEPVVEEVAKADYVDFEEVVNSVSEVDVLVKEMHDCKSYTEVAAHWKLHSSKWGTDPKYFEAKETMKDKFKK